jgi:hypothetical protein
VDHEGDALILSNPRGRGSLWSAALYVEDRPFVPGAPLRQPVKLFRTNRLWRWRSFVHTLADPFLFVHDDELFVFVEAQATRSLGRIDCYSTRDLETFVSHGTILQEPYHLSYPFVFRHEGEIYMIPETAAAGKVALYRFNRFPHGLTQIRTLLEGPYVDSSVIFVDGSWFLFTSSDEGFQIFHTDDILTGQLSAHPRNPITNDPRYTRCGGAPVTCDGRLYRLAQDCSRKYGGNLSVLEILEISRTSYREAVRSENIVDCGAGWNSGGGHHMSVVRFRGLSVVAVDGQQPEYLVHFLPKYLAKTVAELSRNLAVSVR